MKFVLRGASSAALILGLAGGMQAWAQQASQAVTTAQEAPQASQTASGVDQTTAAADAAAVGDRVVITGSLIATTPEDAPKPVEVYTADDLKAQGSPSIDQFIRSLSVSASSGLGFGQTNPDVLAGSGFANVDLRGQGSNGSLVLFNGRRLASTNGGFGADINTIPAEALEAVEVLKDGASATYGAGAVGGVVNFRTRRDIDAPQLSVETTLYDGSQSYKTDFLTGWVGDASNLLLSLSYTHEDPLEATERGFSTLPYHINPAGYTLTAANPGRFQPTLGATNFYTTGPTQFVGGGVNDYYGGTAATVAGVTAAGRAACEAVGGVIVGDIQSGSSVTTPTGCGYAEAPFSQLVSEQNLYRGYAEFNADLSETMEFHVDATYSKSETFAIDRPSAGPNAPVMDNSVSGAACALAQSCYYAIPRQVQVYDVNGAPLPGVLVANPFMQDFLTRTGATTGANGALYTSSAYRPFFFGGNPLYEDGREKQTFHRERVLINAGVKGEFQSEGWLSFLNGINYDYAAQYNQYSDTRILPAIFKSRLQNALLGYGGAGCQAIDRVATDYSSPAAFNRTIGIQSDTAPGTNGCEFFNPFASAWATSIANGAANPQYGGASFENSRALADWLTHNDRTSESLTSATTVDALWSGTVPETTFALPGGEIGWAAGMQWRMTERRDLVYSDDPDEELMILQPCPFPDPSVDEDTDPTDTGNQAGPGQQPGSRGCANAGVGAYYGSGPLTTTGGILPPNFLDSQTIAYFAEVQLPITDRFNVSASVRRESFNGGDIVGDIWSVASKYDVTDNIYVRGSYGTNFRAEEAVDAVPGFVVLDTTNGTSSIFGDNFRINRKTVTDTSIGIEDDTTLNLGVGYQGDIGEGRLRASVDFFEITIADEVDTTSDSLVLRNVFENQPGVGSSAVQANCSAPLVSFIEFSSPCVQGVTTAQDIAAVLRFRDNLAGFITNGFDYNIGYSHPLWGGDASIDLTATNNTVYKVKGYSVNGVPFQGDVDAIGGTNTLTGSGASPSQEWRGNLSLRWSNDVHSINFRTNYIGGMLDNRSAALFGTIVNNPGTANDVISTYGVEPEAYVDFDLNYIYTAPFWEELELRLSVLNIADSDPMRSQGSLGYFTGVGDPRGRRIEIGATKKF
jgi:outer membrane receptor protein involved in Fe transport